MTHRFFASAPKGVEQVLAAELALLGASNVVPTSAGVSFTGSMETGYKACLWSRVASRIFLNISEFEAPTAQALYDGVRDYDWQKLVRPTGTIAVDFTTRRAPQFANTHFGALKAKDAVVDRLRDETGLRPSVNLDCPDLRICVHVDGTHATLSLDLAGESLHRRGYRTKSTVAPLKENLAAAILYLAGWPRTYNRGGALLDPMCGSGTFLVEATLMATDTAPGLLRHAPFGFTRWKDFDPSPWFQLLEEARQRDRREILSSGRLPIFGFDVDATAVSASRANAHHASLANMVRIDVRELSFTERPEGFDSGLLLANPPYGERLGEIRSLARLYRRLGDVLKQRLTGWTGFVLAGNLELTKEVGLRATKRHVLYNGAIECRLLEIPVTAGSIKPLRPIPEKEVLSSETTGTSEEMTLAFLGEDAVSESSISASSASKALQVDQDNTPNGGAQQGAAAFANRLEKNFKRLKKWADQNDVQCFRVYDADIPEYAVAIDVYERWIHVQEYAPPKTIEPAKAERRLQEILASIPPVLGVLPSDVHLKVRQRQRGSGIQYGKFGGEGTFYEVHEGKLKFLVNLSDYLDTGLFLDHRPMRRLIGKLAAHKRFLNLFGYTGTATVHAVAGGATSSVTVDLSNTYLGWARQNLALNGLAGDQHQFIRADATHWMRSAHGHFDLIFIDPPTFSSSKAMDATFDVQRDHRAIIDEALQLLNPGGELYFSTNLQSFKFDGAGLDAFLPQNISAQTIDMDFLRTPRIHQCWRLTRPKR